MRYFRQRVLGHGLYDINAVLTLTAAIRIHDFDLTPCGLTFYRCVFSPHETVEQQQTAACRAFSGWSRLLGRRQLVPCAALRTRVFPVAVRVLSVHSHFCRSHPRVLASQDDDATYFSAFTSRPSGGGSARAHMLFACYCGLCARSRSSLRARHDKGVWLVRLRLFCEGRARAGEVAFLTTATHRDDGDARLWMSVGRCLPAI